MTKENAKELQVDLAKDALVLLTLHGELDVRSHRECIVLSVGRTPPQAVCALPVPTSWGIGYCTSGSTAGQGRAPHC